MIDGSETLFVFIDESGNFDFSAKGTKNFVMACVATTCPAQTAFQVNQLRYDLMAQADDITYFHASEDRQTVRDQFLTLIRQLKPFYRFESISFEKSKLPFESKNAAALYAIASHKLVQAIFDNLIDSSAKTVIIVFDKALRASEEAAVYKILKPYLKSKKIDYRIYFQSVKFDANGQVADYLAWSNFVAAERQEMRPLAALK